MQYLSLKQEVLADVVGSLPKYFNKDEFDVRVMIPKVYMYVPWEWTERRWLIQDSFLY